MNQYLKILLVMSGMAFLVGCHTVEGTLSGAKADWGSLSDQPNKPRKARTESSNTQQQTQTTTTIMTNQVNNPPPAPAANSTTNVIPVTNQPASVSNTGSTVTGVTQTNDADEPEVRSTPNPE